MYVYLRLAYILSKIKFIANLAIFLGLSIKISLFASEFLSKEDLEIMHENIEYFAHGQSDLYKPIHSKVDNSLRSIDLMHFVWNIGERLSISLIDRATFIHTIFPHELKDASIKYLAKNLRTRGVCKIALDIPKTGNYHFKCMKNAPESDLDSTN